MSEDVSKLRRILLPVDLSRDSLAAVEVAFDLAAALGGEVSGLFIEDAELIAAGSLPFAREVGASSGISRRIGYEDIEHGLRATAQQARATLEQVGRRTNVPSCFRVARGDVLAEILTASDGADLVVLGKAGWSVRALQKLGRTCSSIMSRTRVPVLVVERGASLSPPLLAVHDETDAGDRALQFARDLSLTLKWQLTVLGVRGLSGDEKVLREIHQKKPRLLVVPSSLSLKEIASELNCPFILVP